jgi:signal transduction histidine kinase
VVALEAAALASPQDILELRKRVEGIKDLAVRALDEIHNMIFDLRPSLLDDLGLIPAINWYAESKLGSLGARVRIEIGGDERRLEPQVETALFRIVQEAITNIAKHANAENVAISLDFESDSVTIEIEDDGNGFDVQQTLQAARPEDGFGLLGMSERVALLDGRLEITSEPSNGTSIKVRVPVSQRSGQYAESKSAVG